MVSITFNNTSIHSNLIGLYNANNINAAITIGKFFNIEDNIIKEAIEAYSPNNNRSQILEKNSNKIILDAYNANPSSMEVALLNFNQLNENNKIAILGDMFELGKESSFEHKKMIESQINTPKTLFYFVGKEFSNNKIENPNIRFFESFEELKSHLTKNPIVNAFILIKGSRGMALERVLEFL